MVQWHEPGNSKSDSLFTDGPLYSVLEKLDLLQTGHTTPLEAVLIPFSQISKGNLDKQITINTSNTWQFETPEGSIWRVKQIIRKNKKLLSYIEEASSSLETSTFEALKKDIPSDYGTWEISIESPPVSGDRPSIKIKEEGTKVRAMQTLGLFAIFLIAMQEHSKRDLDLLDQGRIQEFYDLLPGDIKPFFKSPIDVRAFGPLYKKAFKSSWGTINSVVEQFTSYGLTKGQLNWITVLVLHEACIYSNRKSVEEGEKMAKNNGGHVWWSITGGSSSIGKVTNALTKDRHFIVLDSPTSIFLKIQKNENTFANGIVKTANCKLTPATEPPYDETLCGKKHTNVSHHTSRCSACARVRDNAERAEQSAAVKEANQLVTNELIVPSTSSPDGKYHSGVRSTLPSNPVIPPKVLTRQQEEMEWQSKNGAIITIKAPEIEDVDDFEALAQEYEDMSAQLLAKATEYDELAKKLRSFGKPSQAVQEAQASVDAAIAAQAAAIERDKEQRAKDLLELKRALLSDKKET